MNASRHFFAALAGVGIASAAYAGPYGPGAPATLNALPADYTLCAEGGKVCKVPAGVTANVAYGMGNKFNTAHGTGDFTCLPKGWVKSPSPVTPQDLGVDDPIPGGAKNCYAKFSGGLAVQAPPASSLATYGPGNPATLASLPADFKLCAEGGKICKVANATTVTYVLYGKGNKFNTAQGKGDFTCLPKGWVKTPSAATPQDVGVDDPIPGGAKDCYVQVAAGTQPPVSPPPVAPPPVSPPPVAPPPVSPPPVSKPPASQPTPPAQAGASSAVLASCKAALDEMATKRGTLPETTARLQTIYQYCEKNVSAECDTRLGYTKVPNTGINPITLQNVIKYCQPPAK